MLKELPLERFEISKQAIVTVMNNGHVLLSEDKHYYSVTFLNIRKKVKILYTERKVEIYFGYNRIAVHPRLKSPHNYSTVKDYLATTHQFMTECNPELFISWAESIDINVKHLIVQIIDNK